MKINRSVLKLLQSDRGFFYSTVYVSADCFYWQSSIFTMTRGISDEKMLQIKFLLTDSSASVPFKSMWWKTVAFLLFQYVTSNIFHPDKPLSRAEYLHGKVIQTYEGEMEIRVLYEMSQRKLTNQMICYGGGNGQCSLREAESWGKLKQ